MESRLRALTLAVVLALAPAARAAEHPSADGRPGVHRVGKPALGEPTVAAGLGYGYTEARGPDDAAHHRLSGRLAAASGVTPWLGFGATLDARYDQHEDDSGFVLDPALTARGALPFERFRLGLDLRLWAPGADSFKLLARGLSFDMTGLFGVELERHFAGLRLGYRIDRSAGAVEHPELLGFGDRVALGLSDFNALLVGLGTTLALDEQRRTEILLETSGDILVGSGAPPAGQSPWRAGAGVRRQLGGGFSGELLTEVSLSGKPSVESGAPLVPIEPRFSILAGVRYVFSPRRPASPPPRPAEPPPPRVAPVAAPVSTELVVRVLDEQGAPVPDAKVSLIAAERTSEVPASEPGRHRFPDAAPGAARLHVEARGFEPLDREVTLERGQAKEVELRLTALPPPSQIRGTVRSFAGRPVAARVRVEPLGLGTTARADGSFELDVPPGAYEVVIEAEGFQTQRRRVRLDPQGVVVLNADLSK